MTFATGRLEEATLTRAALGTTFNQARPLVVPGPLRRAAVVVGDLLAATDVILFGKYTSQEIKLDGEEYLIMREDEVLAVVETV